VAAVFTLGVLLLMPLGVLTRTREALSDMVHAPAFGALALLIVTWILGRRPAAGGSQPPPAAASPLWSPEKVCLAVWVGVSLFGAFSEVLQGFVGRGRSLHDALSNSLGAAAFLSAYLAARSERPARRLRHLAVAIIALSAAWFGPLVTLADVWRQHREVPQLAGFERASELDRWILHHTRITRSRDHASEGTWAARIEFEAGPFTAVVLRMADLDWQGYDALEFDLYLPAALATPLYLKVVDRHYNGRLHDRYDAPLVLRPGANHVRIPLDQIVAGPHGRALDLTRIWWLELYLIDAPRPTELWLDNLRLTQMPVVIER
jgi:hypothetical protein